jgi:succinylglutamate desuccinylase
MNLSEQKEIFSKLEASTFEGVSGVHHFPGFEPGPTVTISVCTHGNEPAGLASAQFLFSTLANKSLKKGEVLLILNNIEATKRYLEAKTDEEKRHCRFIDCNMNRLPNNLFEEEDEKRYEILRARELLPLWRRSTVALDIHSTSQDADPMLIAIGGAAPLAYIQGFPITKIISNIDTVMDTKAVVEFYGSEERPASAFGIECGGHERSESFGRAVDCVSSLLANLEMTDASISSSSFEYEEYAVDSAIFFPNASYECVQIFKNFEFLSKDQVIAEGDGEPIRAPYDCHALFAPSTKKPTHITEEVMFLTLPVKPYVR